MKVNKSSSDDTSSVNKTYFANIPIRLIVMAWHGLFDLDNTDSERNANWIVLLIEVYSRL